MSLPVKLIIEPHILESAFLHGDEKCRDLTREIRETLHCISKKYIPEPKPPKAKIFLSYKNLEADRRWVEDIKEFLDDEGHEVWYDETRLETGSQWERVLYREIEESDLFIAFLSAASTDAKGWHKVELERALLEQRKWGNNTTYIIPVLLTEKALPEDLRPLHALSVYVNTELGLEKLGKDIAKEMNRRNQIAESREKKEFVYICEDEESSGSKIYKRYKSKLEDSEDFMEWYEKVKDTYKALYSIVEYLPQKHKTALQSFGCRNKTDEVFVSINHRAPGILISQGGEAGVCLNGHSLDECDAVKYIRATLKDKVYSVDEALNYILKYKREWSVFE